MVNSELQLKQFGCKLTIRKKEALKPEASDVVTMPPHYVFPTQLPTSQISAPSTTSSPAPTSPVTELPAPAKSSDSSHPPLKYPMAGTFYRSPAPGEPPFVLVGDEVQKGQVIWIIEAMKLMNEIEVDQSGTVAEILVEDGKPVSVDLVMSKNLEPVVSMVLNSFQDPQPRVWWTAVNAVGQLSTDLGPDLQVKYHHLVLPVLAATMDDYQNPRIQVHAASAVLNFSKVVHQRS